MHHPLPRRSFLGSTLGASLGILGLSAFRNPSARAIEPINRPGQPRLLLSLAAYSFRNYFSDISHERDVKTDPSKRIDLFQFIDFCADHDCDGAELTSYYFPKNVAKEYLLRLKRHAFLRGVTISGTAVGNTFTHPAGEKRDREIAHVKQWIQHAHAMGTAHIRVFAGNVQDGQTKDQAKQQCIAALEECCAFSENYGVILGLENHGGIVAEADDLLDIIRAVDSPWLGVNLDTGNFHTDDPYGDIAKCAPYAVNVQLKTELRRRGRPKEHSDLGRLVKIIRDNQFQGYVVLEYEAAEDPWEAVPGILKKMKTLLV